MEVWSHHHSYFIGGAPAQARRCDPQNLATHSKTKWDSAGSYRLLELLAGTQPIGTSIIFFKPVLEELEARILAFTFWPLTAQQRLSLCMSGRAHPKAPNLLRFYGSPEASTVPRSFPSKHLIKAVDSTPRKNNIIGSLLFPLLCSYPLNHRFRSLPLYITSSGLLLSN